MKEAYLEKLKEVRLFAGLDKTEYDSILTCLHAKTTEYEKGHILLLAGTDTQNIGIVLSGCVEISRTDYTGDRLIVNRVEYPDMFGEAFAFAGVSSSPVTVTALEDSTVLNLDYRTILNDETETACRYQKKIYRNMLGIMAQKNLFLSSRLELVTKRSTRAKLAAYLLIMSELESRTEFEIPYDRNQLADYLSVNRSAMSNELSKMRSAGILDFRKNRFVIKQLLELSDIARG